MRCVALFLLYFNGAGTVESRFPGLQVLEPSFGCLVSEGLFHRRKGDVVGHHGLFRRVYLIEVVGLVVDFADDVFLREVSTETHGFLGIFHGVVHRPVGSPAAYKTFVVAV